MQNPEWKQNTPLEQLICILMAVEGNVLNCVEERITPAKLGEKVDPLFDQYRELLPYLRGEAVWVPFYPEKKQ